MKQLVLSILFIVASAFAGFSHDNRDISNNAADQANYISTQFNINHQAVRLALNGYQKLRSLGKLANVQYLTIADFSKPSNEERLFIIDMNIMQVVVKSLVAHGRNSGVKMANQFSNRYASFQSSLGFYITGGIYKGKHGASLELEGVEKGINDQAKERAIVIHGADYVSNTLIQQQGYIGRSLGCPAVPNNQVTKIINTIKGASCLFIYAPDLSYIKKSSLNNL
jgi:hypothetical protein